MERTDLFINGLGNQLFEAEQRRLNAIVIKLNARNKAICRVRVDGFTYGGNYYLPKGVDLTVVNTQQYKTPLHPSLWGELEGYLKDGRTILTDMISIRQTLFNLIAPCTSNQERRDALPEFLVSCVQGFGTMLRRDTEAWSIRDNPRALRQYEKILPRMEFYSAVRLIY